MTPGERFAECYRLAAETTPAESQAIQDAYPQILARQQELPLKEANGSHPHNQA